MTAGRRSIIVVALAVLAAASDAGAAVVGVAASGFAVRHEASVSAAPAKVYDALLQVGSWWSSDHTFSGDARNLSLDARAGGCFCERLKEGGGVEHLRVIHVAPGQTLRMSGALGPLQTSGLAGSMSWAVAADGTGTKLQLTYSVGGFRDGGFDKIATAVDGVLAEQVQRLKLFVETGRPAP